RLHRRAGLGSSHCRRHRPGGNLFSRTAAHDQRMARRLDGGSNYFSIDRRLANGSQSSRAGGAAVFRAGTQSSLQSIAADGGGRSTHGGALPRRSDQLAAWHVVAALRNRRGNRRNVFSQHRPGNGDLLHVAGCRRIVHSGSVWQLAYGDRVWRAAYYFWFDHREEIRWLNNQRSSAYRTKNNHKSRSSTPCTAERRTARVKLIE